MAIELKPRSNKQGLVDSTADLANIDGRANYTVLVKDYGVFEWNGTGTANSIDVFAGKTGFWSMIVKDLAGSPLSVASVYPTTDSTKAGQRFLYQGNEWHYMTQSEIDSAGWTGLVSVGFPAPINKENPSKYIYFDGGIFQTTFDGHLSLVSFNGTIDFIGLGNPAKVRRISADSNKQSYMPYAETISTFKNAGLLKNLEDIGTLNALVFVNNSLSNSTINSLFTQLPSTTKTATIVVSNNPGAATCDATIATAKGYTVVV